MTWPHEEVYPDTVRQVMAQLGWVDQATPLPPTLHARVQARIEGLVAAMPFAQVPPLPVAALVTRVAAFFDLAEARAQQLLQALQVAPGPPWIPSGLPGVRLLPLAGGPHLAGATCVLAYGAPGQGFPRHRHDGDEWTLVLQGWVQEDDGRRWGPGDRLHRAPGSIHALTALEPTPCVCALVSYGGIALVAACPEAGGEDAPAGLAE